MSKTSQPPFVRPRSAMPEAGLDQVAMSDSRNPLEGGMQSEASGSAAAVVKCSFASDVRSLVTTRPMRDAASTEASSSESASRPA